VKREARSEEREFGIDYEITLPAQSSSRKSRQGMISIGPIFLFAFSLETTMTRDGE
jgi:hypothetical protein